MDLYEEMIAGFADSAKDYPRKVRKRKEKGRKVVCYFGSRVPVELVHASGALPFPLYDGGDSAPFDSASRYVLPTINAQARYQVGQHVSGLNPVTPVSDLIVVDCKEADSVRVGDVFEFLGLKVWKLGVPQDWDQEHAFAYYTQQIRGLKEELELLTGESITETGLVESAMKYNRVRKLLELIGALRKKHSPALRGEDFIKMHHYAIKNDPDVAADFLEKIYEVIKREEKEFSQNSKRIMVAGRGFAFGDYMTLRAIEENGGTIVTELMDEGFYQRGEINTEGDPISNIADYYYRKMIPSCLFSPCWQKRWEECERLIEAYKVEGIIYYMLSFDVIYDYEFPILAKRCAERNLAFEKVESSYNSSYEATGLLRTRIESFISICGR